MKRTLRLLLTVGLSLVCVSLFAQKFPNYPIPQQPDTLRILGIGNSFTDDGMMYLPELLEAAGIRNVVLGRLYIAGCSLERHCREYAGNAPAYIYYKSTSNRWETVSKKATLLDGIADERWDVVVLQQASGKSGIYPTYQPWFGRLVEIVRWCCPNAGACIAWQQTWAYARNSQHRDFGRYEKNQQLMYRGIVSSVEQLMRETSVEVVVPSGTAIQDLRNTALCDSLDLTRDGYHLNPGTGRYTAACAWFQTLVAPAFGTNVAGNGCRADAPGGRSLSGGGPQSLHPAVLRLDGTCRRRGRDGSPVAVGGGRGIPPCRYRYPAIRRSIPVICRMWVRSSPCPLPTTTNEKRGLQRPLRAENGIRTRDPQLGKLMLYRLSYFRITEYKVTPFFLFVKFSAAEKCAYPTIFFSDARFSGFFRLRPSAE